MASLTVINIFEHLSVRSCEAGLLLWKAYHTTTIVNCIIQRHHTVSSYNVLIQCHHTMTIIIQFHHTMPSYNDPDQRPCSCLLGHDIIMASNNVIMSSCHQTMSSCHHAMIRGHAAASLATISSPLMMKLSTQGDQCHHHYHSCNINTTHHFNWSLLVIKGQLLVWPT